MSDVYNASDVAHIRKAEAQQKHEEDEFLSMLATRSARAWMYRHIFEDCHIERPSYVPHDEGSTQFNEGARAVGMKLLQDIRMQSPKLYMMMLEENHFDE